MNIDELYIETSRFERKYRLPFNHYFCIKSSLYPYLRKDLYTHGAPGNKYLVRSLYFDTFDYRLFNEKINGNCHRTKFRIRTYGTSVEDQPDIRVEIKIRQADLTTKYGAYITKEDYESFIRNRHWDNRNDPVLVEFERQSHRLNLVPRTLVEYQREGFHTNDGDNIRITFDHRIKSAPASTLFPENVFWHIHHNQMVVMEIKHQETVPVWLNRIIREYGLKLVANSKFVLGTQASRPDVIFPGWSNQ
jgi:hypothetical protein